MKKLYMLLIVLSLSVVFVACEGSAPSADKEQANQTEEAMQEANRQVGMPNIINFQERKLMKEILELRDRSNLITYLYTQNLEGKYIYEGQAIGFGLPASVQYTNPDRRIGDGIDGEIATISQPDPNGLFMPVGLSATWIMLMNEETGETEVAYFEPGIVVTQSKKPARLVAEWSLPDNY